MEEKLNKIVNAIDSNDEELAESLIIDVYSINDKNLKLGILNELLITPGHWQHQEITREIQDIANPKSIPYIKKILETNFNFLEYTCSEPEVIAKWFSWALFSIGTQEAIEIIIEFTDSVNEGISSEMKYRLQQIET